MSQGSQFPHICFSLKPTRTGESLLCILMSDLYAKSLFGHVKAAHAGKEKKKGAWLDFGLLCQLCPTGFVAASFMVEHVKATLMSGTSWSHFPLWQILGPVWSSHPKQGFSPALEAPTCTLVMLGTGTEEGDKGTGSFGSISKPSGLGELCKA